MYVDTERGFGTGVSDAYREKYAKLSLKERKANEEWLKGTHVGKGKGVRVGQ